MCVRVVEEHQVGKRRHDNGGGESPWLSLLDPSANAAALGDIQRRGLRAAGELVDRLIGAVDGDTPQDPGTGGAPPSPTEPTHGDGAGANGTDGAPPGTLRRPLAPGVPSADLLHAWVDLFQRGLQAMAAVARTNGGLAPGGESIATADVGRGTATGAVRLTIRGGGSDDRPGASDERAGGSDGPSGRSGSTEVWLHNGTSEPMLGLRLHSADLRSHDGSTLPASCIGFDPPSLDELPARSSRGVLVVADVGADVPGGVYHGVLLVAGAPDVWLPVIVTVASGE
jgi:hypothetical protein